jgi:putative transposase
MRKSCFTEAQIIGMIKEQEAGLPTAERAMPESW